jgi:hypothetical protein
MKDLENTVIGAITTRMPRNEHGEIADKCLHSDLINAVNEAFSLYSVVGQSGQFKCDCGCTNHYKNEIHDSVMCADCGTVYARI